MIDLEDLYFEWLLKVVDPDGVTEGVMHLCGLLHNCEFHRRVGNDINRAIDGANMRKEFMADYAEADFDPNVTNDLMLQECSWLEMLIALSRTLDYLYEGGVDGRLYELLGNMNVIYLAEPDPHRTRATTNFDQRIVNTTTRKIDQNRFTADGHGGIFPLDSIGHPDQREVEIWDQHAAYFGERLQLD